MKVICLVSHEQPGVEPGKFKKYVAGEFYNLETFEDKLFQPVKNKKIMEKKNAN